jgi:hypothetical protein
MLQLARDAFPIAPSHLRMAPRGWARRREAGRSAAVAEEFLNHYRQLVVMIDLLERLPDLVEDIRDFRAPHYVEYFRNGPELQSVAGPRGYEPYDPMLRRAFVACASGLERLSGAIVAACNTAGALADADDIDRCAAIGLSIRRLLERAVALSAFAGEPLAESAQARADLIFFQGRMRANLA